jgi:hypothetical protein
VPTSDGSFSPTTRANRGNSGDHVVVAEIRLVGADRGIRCSQRGVPASVLVGSSTSGQSPNLGRVTPRASPEFHQRQTLHWA